MPLGDADRVSHFCRENGRASLHGYVHEPDHDPVDEPVHEYAGYPHDRPLHLAGRPPAGAGPPRRHRRPGPPAVRLPAGHRTRDPPRPSRGDPRCCPRLLPAAGRGQDAVPGGDRAVRLERVRSRGRRPGGGGGDAARPGGDLVGGPVPPPHRGRPRPPPAGFLAVPARLFPLPSSSLPALSGRGLHPPHARAGRRTAAVAGGRPASAPRLLHPPHRSPRLDPHPQLVSRDHRDGSAGAGSVPRGSPHRLRHDHHPGPPAGQGRPAGPHGGERLAGRPVHAGCPHREHR